MANLDIVDGTQVRMVLHTVSGPIMDINLLGLYLVNKYGGEEKLIGVRIPERWDEEAQCVLPQIYYDILIREREAN